MKAFANDLRFMIFSADDYAADGWIGAGQANAITRKFQCALHEANVMLIHELVEEGSRVRFGVEGNHIVNLFAGADEADRQPEFAGNRNDDAALGRAIQFGENNSRDANSARELARLRQ